MRKRSTGRTAHPRLQRTRFRAPLRGKPLNVFEFEPLDQLYRRVGEARYRYESAGGEFTADLEVDASGFVTRYPEFAQRESG